MGLKSKTQLYTIYKKPPLNIQIWISWKLNTRKIYHANINQKKAGVAIFISEK